MYFTHWILEFDRFTGRVGDPVPYISDDVLEAPPDHAGFLSDRLQTAANDPVVPPALMLAGKAFIEVFKEGHHRFLQRPGSCSLQIAVSQGGEFLPVTGFHAGGMAQPVVPRAGQTVVALCAQQFLSAVIWKIRFLTCLQNCSRQEWKLRFIGAAVAGSM